MKKLIALVLAVVCVLGLVGCNNKTHDGRSALLLLPDYHLLLQAQHQSSLLLLKALLSLIHI